MHSNKSLDYFFAGKGKSIWDTFAQTPGNIYKNDTGNIACDSYHKYKEDVQLIKNLGVNIHLGQKILYKSNSVSSQLLTMVE